MPGKRVSCHREKRLESYEGKKNPHEQGIRPKDPRKPGEGLNSAEVKNSNNTYPTRMQKIEQQKNKNRKVDTWRLTSQIVVIFLAW